MTQRHVRQQHMFEAFERAAPLRRAAVRDGFRWCDACNGTGRQYDPLRMCPECMGMGQVLA